MVLMTKNGAYMNVYNPDEAKRAKAKGWRIIKEVPKKKSKKK